MKPGDVVAGRYRLEARLGVGGMGEVWRAIHTGTERSYALKFMHAHAAASTSARQRFMREARASAKINHPSIIDVLDVDEVDDGVLFLAMELLDGISLADAFHATPALSAQDLLAVMYDAARALAAAHAVGIIHRDIKPGNIFLHRDRASGFAVAKILDFGISKFAATDSSEATQAGSVLGSPRYMSPEQTRSASAVDQRSDLWACGVILFEGLTGTWPHEGDSFSSLVVAIVSDPPRSIDATAPALPEGVRSIVRDCLSPLARRIASATDLATRLAAALADPSLAAMTLPRPLHPPGEGIKSTTGLRVRPPAVSAPIVDPAPAPSGTFRAPPAAIMRSYAALPQPTPPPPLGSSAGAPSFAAPPPSFGPAPAPAPSFSSAPRAAPQAPGAPGGNPPAAGGHDGGFAASPPAQPAHDGGFAANPSAQAAHDGGFAANPAAQPTARDGGFGVNPLAQAAAHDGGFAANPTPQLVGEGAALQAPSAPLHEGAFPQAPVNALAGSFRLPNAASATQSPHDPRMSMMDPRLSSTGTTPRVSSASDPLVGTASAMSVETSGAPSAREPAIPAQSQLPFAPPAQIAPAPALPVSQRSSSTGLGLIAAVLSVVLVGIVIALVATLRGAPAPAAATAASHAAAATAPPEVPAPPAPPPPASATAAAPATAVEPAPDPPPPDAPSAAPSTTAAASGSAPLASPSAAPTSRPGSSKKPASTKVQQLGSGL